jgi:hypothetical protein
MIFSHGFSLRNNNRCGRSANRDYVFVLISEQAVSKMEYEDALAGGSNMPYTVQKRLHKVVEGNWSANNAR